MGKANVFSCDVGGCERTATAVEGAVVPPDWAFFHIEVKSATPLATGQKGGHRSSAQVRAVYCCPEHASRLLASLPVPGDCRQLGPGGGR